MYADDFDTKAKEQKVRKEEEAAAAETNLKTNQDDGTYRKGTLSLIFNLLMSEPHFTILIPWSNGFDSRT